MTTTLLANLDIPILNQVVSSSTRQFTSRLSRKLEALNVNAAKSIENGSLGGADLDSKLIRMEQTAVQDSLDTLRDSDSVAYTQLIGEMNQLLNPSGTTGAAAKFYKSDRAYLAILATVRQSLGRDIDFSKQSDREAIGQALVQGFKGGCLRGPAQGGCDD